MSGFNTRFFAEMYEVVRPLVRGAVTPIGVYAGGNPFPLGTGTLFVIGDRHFLVTAAHVFTEAKRFGDGQICAFNYGEEVEQGRKLVDVELGGTKVYFEDGPPDVGIMALSPETVAELAGRQFLRLDHVALQPELPGWGWVSGFPNEWCQPATRQTNRYEPLQLGALMPAESPTGLLNFDRSMHFTLTVDRGDLWRSDGEPGSLPVELKGISGCPVWQTWWPSVDRKDAWRSRKARVVGVQVSVYDKHKPPLIKATSWHAVAHLICGQYPEHLPAFQMRFDDLL